MDLNAIPKAVTGEVFRHYKGDLYMVVDPEAIDCTNDTPAVAYVCVSNADKRGRTFFRTPQDFYGDVEYSVEALTIVGRRFAPIGRTSAEVERVEDDEPETSEALLHCIRLQTSYSVYGEAQIKNVLACALGNIQPQHMSDVPVHGWYEMRVLHLNQSGSWTQTQLWLGPLTFHKMFLARVTIHPVHAQLNVAYEYFNLTSTQLKAKIDQDNAALHPEKVKHAFVIVRGAKPLSEVDKVISELRIRLNVNASKIHSGSPIPSPYQSLFVVHAGADGRYTRTPLYVEHDEFQRSFDLRMTQAWHEKFSADIGVMLGQMTFAEAQDLTNKLNAEMEASTQHAQDFTAAVDYLAGMYNVFRDHVYAEDGSYYGERLRPAVIHLMHTSPLRSIVVYLTPKAFNKMQQRQAQSLQERM